ncbi:S24 family peptidase [Alloalcanivorax xenomutans]
MTRNQEVKQRREALGISQKKLAEEVSERAKQPFSQQALGKFEKGDSSGSKFLVYILETLEELELAVGLQTSKDVSPGPRSMGDIPIISWIQAGDLCETIDNFHPGDAEHFVPFRPRGAGPRTFALWVRGKSNFPKFQEGEVVLVDPDKDADPGQFVIAKKGLEEATLKQLIFEDGQYMLKAYNPDWPQQYIMMDESWHICGVVIGKAEMFI